MSNKPYENDQSDSAVAEDPGNHTTAPTDQSEDTRPGNRFTSGLKTIGRVTAKVTAADVIAKDISRIRPRHPQLWRDIFSGRWRKLDRRTKKGGRSPALTVAVICGVMTFGLLAYTLLLSNSASSNTPLNNYAIATLILALVAGLFQTASYGVIAFIQAKHRNKTGGPATNNNKGGLK